MTAPTLKLSDLAGPDAAGWSDVAVFVRADGSDDGEPFVVGELLVWDRVAIHYPSGKDTRGGSLPVRRLGRGRWEPARIVMEGETTRPLGDDDAFEVYSLADELYRAKDDERPDIVAAIREILDNKPLGVMTLDESLELRTLADWKAEQLAVESEWDAQAVGRLLRVPLGQSVRAAIQPGIEALQRRVAELKGQACVLRAALEWYAEQSRLCRLIHGEGDAGRNALSGDGGQRARAAIAATGPKPGEDAK